LVLGQLLIHRIPAYKTYTNMPGYDLVATNPELGSSARIQVKSRWRTGAPGFLINNFGCEFVVVVRLNRGSRTSNANVLPPEYFVFPVDLVKSVHKSATWGKAYFRDISDVDSYRDAWPRISKHLKLGGGINKQRDRRSLCRYLHARGRLVRVRGISQRSRRSARLVPPPPPRHSIICEFGLRPSTS
jgi:hypothetical protein